MACPKLSVVAIMLFMVSPRCLRLISSFRTSSAHRKRFRLSSVPSSKTITEGFLKREELIDIASDKLSGYFNFPLDDWQLEAGGAICEGYNVIVCAPTGAGKTVVGEMALLHAYDKGECGMYTTPLKALSNQKFSDLCSMFGREETGLSTGDISVNKGARITVMTTEVYRNIAWRSSTPTATVMGTSELDRTSVVVLDEFHYMGIPRRGGVWEECVITSPQHMQIVGLSATLSNAAALAEWMQQVTGRRTILVEVPGQKRPVPLRYLFAMKDGLYPLFRDPDAGPGAPKGLLGYRGDGEVDQSGGRSSTKGGFGEAETIPKSRLPLGLQLNPALRASARKRIQKVDRALERQRARHKIRVQEEDDNDWRRPRTPMKKMTRREEQKERERLLKNEMRRAVPSLPAVLSRLKQKNLLPAIFFIFSRAGCDNAARSVYQHMKGPDDPTRLLQSELVELGIVEERRDGSRRGKAKYRNDNGVVRDSDGRTFRETSSFLSEDTLEALENVTPLADDEFDDATPLSPKNWDFYSKAGLLTYAEVRNVASRVSRFNDENPEIAFDDETTEQYLFGCGSHHAGMLPAHKSFVEILYRNELMKVVFATETLAAGINMPARTTVVCALAKRSDNSAMNLLETSNLLQMAGRAGRRGMDTDGTCVIVATPFESHDEASKILLDPVKPIASQFSPSYSLTVNLIARGEGKLDIAEQLVSNSFAMWEKKKAELKMSNLKSTTDGMSDVNDVLLTSAQERFMNLVVYTLQEEVERRSARFDLAKLEKHLNTLMDRELLKKTSKSYAGTAKVLELEEMTLHALEDELIACQNKAPESSETNEPSSSEQYLTDQILTQRERVMAKQKEVARHPFSFIADAINVLMENSEGPSSTVLMSSLQAARVDSSAKNRTLSASELSTFSKSAVVFRRKSRKLQSANPDVDTETLLQIQLDEMDTKVNSWNDMLAITQTLLAYGCLSSNDEESIPIEERMFEITSAGLNIGMMGFDNSLWALVAMGGAADASGASNELDKFRAAMSSYGAEEATWYEEETEKSNDTPDSVGESRKEAYQLTEMLKGMSPCELAGYVACLVSDSSRRTSGPVYELLQNLSPLQHQVIQASLKTMERLIEVQKVYNVDEKTRSCPLDISNAKVVTAWASGCTWQEALDISAVPPGDLVRTLSRVLDALRQYGNLPFTPERKDEGTFTRSPEGLHPRVRQLCRDAARLINRYPVKDPLQFEDFDEDIEIVDADEDFDEETNEEADSVAESSN